MSRKSLRDQAKQSHKRLETLQKDLKTLLMDGVEKTIKKQTQKILAYVKKNQNKQALFKIKVEDFKAPNENTIKDATELLLKAYDEEALSIQKNLELDKIKSVATVRQMFKNLSSSDVNDLLSKIDNIMLYQLLEMADAWEDPKLIESQLFRSATTTMTAEVNRGKASVLPAKVINTARQQSFDQHFDEIVTYTYYNPSPKADICVYLAGKTVNKDDPGLLQPPLHYNCSTVLLPNLSTFKNNPTAQKLAPNQKQIESINIGVKGMKA